MLEKLIKTKELLDQVIKRRQENPDPSEELLTEDMATLFHAQGQCFDLWQQAKDQVRAKRVSKAVDLGRPN